ncbi:hypothetical protein M9H77_31218 [Catharanthus roseus]|uniref:Uncharacterized protein n=1 Tax=Catharanthus roseus TaxID=4058 RepID=A0ACC0A3D7_CATRO|nr:hypothetical protein M9H77_31218 [Catharanthus roseus]
MVKVKNAMLEGKKTMKKEELAKVPERFISVKGAATFEEWTRKMRKIASGHRVDLFDMEDDNDESDEDDEGNKGQEAMNVDEEESEEESEEETFRREMRQKKRQERVEEGQAYGSMSQLMYMIASMQASMNSHFDALDGEISDIKERKKFYEKNKRCTKESQG